MASWLRQSLYSPIPQVSSAQVSPPIVLNCVASSAVQLIPPFIACCRIVLLLDLVDAKLDAKFVSLHNESQDPQSLQSLQTQSMGSGIACSSLKSIPRTCKNSWWIVQIQNKSRFKYWKLTKLFPGGERLSSRTRPCRRRTPRHTPCSYWCSGCAVGTLSIHTHRRLQTSIACPGSRLELGCLRHPLRSR